MNANSNADNTEYDADHRFVMLRDYPMYTIDPVYPHYIRKGNGGTIIENVNEEGYVTVFLNGEKCYKHRIIAQQFIPNPEERAYVDHINHDRSDNHVNNLRWVSPLENARNRASSNGIKYEFVDELEADAIQINFVKGYEYEGYWLSGNEILYYDGVRYRIVIKHARGNQWIIRMRDVERNSRTVSKRQLDKAMSEEYGKDFNI